MKKLNQFPVLRFAEFNDSWTNYTLEKVSNDIMYGMNSSAIPFDGQHKYIRITDIDEVTRRFVPKPLTSPDGNIDAKFRLRDGDILFTRTGASVGKSYLYNKDDGNVYFAGFLIKFSIVKADPDFVFYHTQRHEYKRWVKLMSMRSGQPGINAEEYKALILRIPSFNEQVKVSRFLKTIDDKIQQFQKKKDLLELYKKGIMQRIFNQEIRFKDDGGNEYLDWKAVQLSEILIEHKTRNIGNRHAEVFSVAKNKGVINQVEHLGRSYASLDISNYKVAKPHDIIYTKSPTSDFPYGIIKQNKLGRTGVVSVLYAVFSPKNMHLGYLLDEYFSSNVNTYNYLNPLVQKGAKNTMNIGNNEFLAGAPINLPESLEEEEKVANLLRSLNAKIILIGNHLEGLLKYKKGLLQQMFV